MKRAAERVGEGGASCRAAGVLHPAMLETAVSGSGGIEIDADTGPCGEAVGKGACGCYIGGE